MDARHEKAGASSTSTYAAACDTPAPEAPAPPAPEETPAPDVPAPDVPASGVPASEAPAPPAPEETPAPLSLAVSPLAPLSNLSPGLTLLPDVTGFVTDVSAPVLGASGSAAGVATGLTSPAAAAGSFGVVGGVLNEPGSCTLGSVESVASTFFSTGSALFSVIPPATASEACGNEFASTDVAAEGTETVARSGFGEIGAGSSDSTPLMPL